MDDEGCVGMNIG